LKKTLQTSVWIKKIESSWKAWGPTILNFKKRINSWRSRSICSTRVWKRWKRTSRDSMEEMKTPWPWTPFFVKAKYMTHLSFSLDEREAISEGGILLPPYPSCGGLKKESDEKSFKTQPAPSLKRSNNSTNQGKKTCLIFHLLKEKILVS